VKLADAMVRLAGEAQPPMRFVAGAFAFETAEKKYREVLEEMKNWRDLSLGTDFQ